MEDPFVRVKYLINILHNPTHAYKRKNTCTTNHTDSIMLFEGPQYYSRATEYQK